MQTQLTEQQIKEVKEQKRLFAMKSEQMNSKSVQDTVDEIMSGPSCVQSNGTAV